MLSGGRQKERKEEMDEMYRDRCWVEEDKRKGGRDGWNVPVDVEWRKAEGMEGRDGWNVPVNVEWRKGKGKGGRDGWNVAVDLSGGRQKERKEEMDEM
jgi:hypothetical protein